MLQALFWIAFLAPGPDCTPGAQPSCYQAEWIFPPEHWHTHSSCIIECPNGDLLACWYHGSGEKTADDLKIEGARKKRGAPAWGPRFLLADTPGFPDANPCMFIDAARRLWLLWPVLIANEWPTALLKYKVSSFYQAEGPPRWETSEVLHVKPGSDFAEAVHRQCAAEEAVLEQFPSAVQARARAFYAQRRRDATDKYRHRMGWMTRTHPCVLHGGRLIVPLYSDGFGFSLMALSDDGGMTWTASAPLLSSGIQPSLVLKNDGTLVAFLRDNGPPPRHILLSESSDQGQSWTRVRDSELPNPGSSIDVVRLRNGRWLLAYNDCSEGRHSLAVALSDDEGMSWKWQRHLERESPGPAASDFAYPSLLQATDGALHVTYSCIRNGPSIPVDVEGRLQREAIRHVRFCEEWIVAGD